MTPQEASAYIVDLGDRVTALEQAEIAHIAAEYLPFFEYGHLPPDLQAASKPFKDLAVHITTLGPQSVMLVSALRKLLESKDAAVRARLFKKPEAPAEKKET